MLHCCKSARYHVCLRVVDAVWLELSVETSEPDSFLDDFFSDGNGCPEMGQALTSRSRTPATQHQRPSNLVASSLTAVCGACNLEGFVGFARTKV